MAPDGASAVFQAVAFVAVGAWLAERATRVHAAGRSSIPLLAAALAAVYGSAVLAGPPPVVLLASLTLGWALVCLAAIDLISFRLPDLFTLPLMLAGLSVAAILPGGPVGGHAAGALAGWGVLALLAGAYRFWRGVDGIGLGDAKLLGAAGAWLGWRPLSSVVLIACALAFAWVAILAIRRGRAVLDGRIAFGVPLCLSIWIVWISGPLYSV